MGNKIPTVKVKVKVEDLLGSSSMKGIYFSLFQSLVVSKDCALGEKIYPYLEHGETYELTVSFRKVKYAKRK